MSVSTIVSNLNQALTDASNAQISANTANTLLSDIANDSKLTSVEKKSIKVQLDAIIAEKSILDAQATTYGITTEKTNYDSAYTALNTYITPLLADLTMTSDIIGDTFSLKFSNYYSSKVSLLNKISDVIQSQLNNLQIGGRNLLIGSSNGIGWDADTKSNTEFSVTRASAVESGFILSPTLSLYGGLTVTLSFESKESANISSRDLCLLPNNYPAISLLTASFPKSTTWVGQTITFVTPTDWGTVDAPAQIRLRIDHNGSTDGLSATIWARKIKLEIGNKATDWTPAIEDLVQVNTNYNSTYITQDGVQVKNGTGTEVVKMGEFTTGLYGLRASHSDGSHTQLTANGFERFIASSNFTYQYDTYTIISTTEGLSKDIIYTEDWQIYNGGIDPTLQIAVWEQGKAITMPPHYRGKTFKAFASLITFFDTNFDDPDLYFYGAPVIICEVSEIQVGDPTGVIGNSATDAIVYVKVYWLQTGREYKSGEWIDFSWYKGLKFLLTVII